MNRFIAILGLGHHLICFVQMNYEVNFAKQGVHNTKNGMDSVIWLCTGIRRDVPELEGVGAF